MGDLRGRHALVTGGGRGIGRAIASRLSAAGARVTVVGRTQASLADVVEAGDAEAYATADVTDAASVGKALAKAVEGLGPVDLLVANAGAADSAPFTKMKEEQLRRLLDINLFGLIHPAQAVLPGMLERGQGRIVAIASMASLKGYPYLTAYCATKHAVVGVVRALAAETAGSGVTVNAVCPGYTATDIVEDTIVKIVSTTGRSREQALAALVKNNPQARLVMPEEVATAVLYLCSAHAASITGHLLPIAGGET